MGSSSPIVSCLRPLSPGHLRRAAIRGPPTPACSPPVMFRLGSMKRVAGPPSARARAPCVRCTSASPRRCRVTPMASTQRARRGPTQGLPRHRTICSPDEERDIRDTVRAFVARPRASRCRATGSRRPRFPTSEPRHSSAKLGACSACTCRLTAVPGADRQPLRGSPAWSSRPAIAACARSSPCRARSRCYAIWRWGSESQKLEWLPRIAAGEAIGCFGLTEPDAGSDPGSMPHARRPRRDGSDLESCTGRKWITNGSIADVGRRVGRHRQGTPRLSRTQGDKRPSARRTSTASCAAAPRSPPSCCSTDRAPSRGGDAARGHLAARARVFVP